MMAEKIAIYLFDTDPNSGHRYLGHKDADQGYEVKYGETTVKPFNDNQYWNGYTWVDELINVYLYDQNNRGRFLGVKKSPRGTQLQPGETLIEIPQGLYDAKFNGSSWVGISQEAYQKQHPGKVSPQQEFLAKTAKDLAELQASHSSQQKLNASLMVQNANLKKNNDTQSMVNAKLMKQVANLQKQITTLTSSTASNN